MAEQNKWLDAFLEYGQCRPDCRGVYACCPPDFMRWKWDPPCTCGFCKLQEEAIREQGNTEEPVDVMEACGCMRSDSTETPEAAIRRLRGDTEEE